MWRLHQSKSCYVKKRRQEEEQDYVRINCSKNVAQMKSFQNELKTLNMHWGRGYSVV